MAIPPDHRLDAAPQVGLGALLAAATRRQSDGVLAVATGAGVLAAAVAAVAGPEWRTLALAGLAAAAFGGWGILDRTLADRVAAGAPQASDGPLRTLGGALLVAGWAALALFLLVGFGRVLAGVIH